MEHNEAKNEHGFPFLPGREDTGNRLFYAGIGLIAALAAHEVFLYTAAGRACEEGRPKAAKILFPGNSLVA